MNKELSLSTALHIVSNCKHYTIHPYTSVKRYFTQQEVLLLYYIRHIYFSNTTYLHFDSKEAEPIFQRLPDLPFNLSNTSFCILSMLLAIPNSILTSSNVKDFLSDFSICILMSADSEHPEQEVQVHFMLKFSCPAIRSSLPCFHTICLRQNLKLVEAYQEIITHMESFKQLDPSYYDSISKKLSTLKANYCKLIQ